MTPRTARARKDTILSKAQESQDTRDKQTLLTNCPCDTTLPGKNIVTIGCTRCQQTWHAQCVNLDGISVASKNKLMINGWLCPNCYECPLARKRSSSSSENIEKQIASLEQQISKMAAPLTQQDITTIHDDILKGIKFDLETITDKKVELTIASELADMRASISKLEDALSNPSAVNPSSSTQVKPMYNIHQTATGPPKYVHESCPPYTHYDKDFLSQELKTKVEEYVNSNLTSFTEPASENARRLLYFGKYGYRYGNHEHKTAPVPDVIQEVMGKISEEFPDNRLNSCLITYYESGKVSLPAHSDDEPFFDIESDIFTISLGSQRTMEFTECRGTGKDQLELHDNSITAFSRYSQNDWRHAILPNDNITEPRFSLTFRNLAPFNMNSTIVCGDSNTSELKFGNGKDAYSFGTWLPGKRIKSARIKNIPPPDKLGPYRNLVLHVGINDLSDPNCKPLEELAHEYETRCKDILNIYPKMLVFISLILPTKSSYLNVRANEFNMYLANMASKYQNMSLINHMYLVDSQGFLNPTYGRYENGRPSNDSVHLGSAGYRIFVNNMRDTVITKRKRVPRRNIAPYKDRTGPSTQRPAPRPPRPLAQRDLHPAPSSTFLDLHPSRSGFAPFGPFPALSRPLSLSRPLLPSPGSFNGDYSSAVGRRNYVLPYPGSDDRHHY
jgi:alkylated DNA repair dioxygenase AlkB